MLKSLYGRALCDSCGGNLIAHNDAPCRSVFPPDPVVDLGYRSGRGLLIGSYVRLARILGPSPTAPRETRSSTGSGARYGAGTRLLGAARREHQPV